METEKRKASALGLKSLRQYIRRGSQETAIGAWDGPALHRAFIPGHAVSARKMYSMYIGANSCKEACIENRHSRLDSH